MNTHVEQDDKRKSWCQQAEFQERAPIKQMSLGREGNLESLTFAAHWEFHTEGPDSD